jgi:peptide/nickel transport system ATP-binding protein
LDNNIYLEDVTISFTTKAGNVHAVNHVDMTFNSGEITGMIGETGSGKSVLGMSVLRLLAANSLITGNIIYKNIDLLQLNEKELNQIRGKIISFIPQNPDAAFDPTMTIGKQIIEGYLYHNKKSKTTGISHGIWQLQNYSFHEPQKTFNSYSFQLSGGMRQRALCAMGTAHSPEWIIADEPTKGLDAIIRQQVSQVFQDLKTTTTSSIILITHDLRLAQRICDAVIVLYAGTVLEQGPADKIFAEPLHPYTCGLIDAQPHRKLLPLFGMPPSLIDLPAGCKFHPRCSCRKDICCLTEPALQDVNGRQVRCWKYA